MHQPWSAGRAACDGGPAEPVRSSRDPVLHSVARGDVAQLGEHRVRIAGVRGSSPLISTTVPAMIPHTRSCAGLSARMSLRPNPLSASEGRDTRPMSAAPHHAAHEDAQGAQDRQGGTPGPAEGEISDYRSGLKQDFDALKRFNLALRGEGVLKGDTKFYVSTVHDDADVAATLSAFAVALDAEVAFRK